MPVSSAEVFNIIRQDSGNVVMINAWASWCKPCKEEMPYLLRMKKELHDKKFKLILVSGDDLDELESAVRPALKKLGVDFTTYIMNDSTQEAFMEAMNPVWDGAFALPTSYLYDAKGKFVTMLVGGKTYKQFVETLLPLLRK